MFDELRTIEAVGFEEVFLQFGIGLGRVGLGEFGDGGPVRGVVGGEVEFEDFGDLQGVGV